MKVKDLALKLAEKEPDLIRDIASSHYINFDTLELQQGRILQCKIKEKHYKS